MDNLDYTFYATMRMIEQIDVEGSLNGEYKMFDFVSEQISIILNKRRCFYLYASQWHNVKSIKIR